MSPAWGPMVSTQPKTTSSTAPGRCPVRSIERLERVGAEVGGVDLDEPAAPPADRRADGVDDVGLGHACSSSAQLLLDDDGRAVAEQALVGGDARPGRPRPGGRSAWPRSCQVSSHTWAMAWAGMASPKQARPPRRVDRDAAADAWCRRRAAAARPRPPCTGRGSRTSRARARWTGRRPRPGRRPRGRGRPPRRRRRRSSPGSRASGGGARRRPSRWRSRAARARCCG